MELNFSNMFYKGLDFSDPNIATEIMNQYEFRRLATSAYEPFPSRGELFNHQRVIRQMFLLTDALLLVHATGTGKGCSIVHSLEQFRSSLMEEVVNYVEQYMFPQKVPYKKFIILVRGPILLKAMEKEIICKCNKRGVYDTKDLREAKTVNMRNKILDSTFKKYYKIIGYDKFASDIQKGIEPDRNEDWSDKIYEQYKKESKQRLVEEYSNCIFVADEVHTLTTEINKETKSRYRFIKDLFHSIKNCKILLSTASPMKNKSIEFADIMNLILPPDNQIPISLMHKAFPPLKTPIPSPPDEEGKEEEEKEEKEKEEKEKQRDEEEGKEQLMTYIKGKISFVRAMDIGIDTESNHGQEDNIMEEDEYPFHVRHVPMSKEQSKAYLREKKKRGTQRSAVYTSEINISNAWFPPPSLKGVKGEGVKGKFKDYFKFKNNSYILKEEQKSFRKEYLKPKSKVKEGYLPPFAEISPKAVEACEIIENTERKVFVFSNHRDLGVGVVSISLENVYGYKHFKEDDSLFSASVVTEGKGFCPVEERTTNKKVRLEKAKRYALLFAESSKNINILEQFNSWENRFGEYIKVLIVSQFGREGINTNEVFTFINFDGHWNPTSYYQALSRILRSNAFLWSMKEERNKFLDEGRDPKDARLTLNIYNLSSVSLPSLPKGEGEEGEEEEGEEGEEEEEGLDIDDAQYLTSMIKDIDIQRVMRMIKEVSVDCFVHYNRNYRPEDVDYSPECNYKECKYSCAVSIQPDKEPKYDRYDVIFGRDEVEKVKFGLHKIFEKEPSNTFENLKKKFPEYREMILTQALYEMVKNREQVVDKFGSRVYIQEDKGLFFAQRELPKNLGTSSFSLSEYVYNTPLVSENSLVQVLIDTAVEEIKDKINNGMDIEENIQNLDPIQRATYIEESVLSYILSSAKVWNEETAREDFKKQGKNYVSLYTNRIYSINEPIEMIEEQARSTAFWDKRGRKPENPEIIRIKPIASDSISEYENELKKKRNDGRRRIFMHALLNLDTTAEYERFFKGEAIIRILSVPSIPSELPTGEKEKIEWRDANPYETKIYNNFIQVLIQQQIQAFTFPYYGFLLSNGKLKVDTVQKGKEEKDLRKRTKGVEVDKLEPAIVKQITGGRGKDRIRDALETKKQLFYVSLLSD